jgi:uncharacterized protein (DUF1800 family)
MANRDTRALVAHLFRRAGFGLRPDELDHFTQLGIQGSVDYLVNYDAVTDPAEARFPLPDLSSYTPEEIRAAQRTAQTQKAAGKLRVQAALAIQEWWINRMLATARPLQEKMTLFWHGHFATALSKAPAPLMLQQNQSFRGMALGNFDALLKAINQDPAMLLWLDGAHNRAGKPNENFARELMELFTIGLGTFSEPDVREGARALTGWTLPAGYRYTSSPVQAIFRPRLHDGGSKTYLGHTGNFDSADVMDILATHPATGTFMARKLFRFFANDNPDDATLKALATTYYSSRYSIKAMVRQLLLSEAFYADSSFEQHIKSPVEFAVGTVRELGVGVPALLLARALALMGQTLFNPPNVGGWPGGVSWINASTLVERFNFAGMLALPRKGETNPLTPRQLVQESGTSDGAGFVRYLLTRFLGIGATPITEAALAAYLGPTLAPSVVETRVRALLQLVLATPEYQLN